MIRRFRRWKAERKVRIDYAPIPQRLVIEFWWKLEKVGTRYSGWYFDKHEDEVDIPRWASKIDVLFYRKRKAAERRALKVIDQKGLVA